MRIQYGNEGIGMRIEDTVYRNEGITGMGMRLNNTCNKLTLNQNIGIQR